MGSIPKSKTKDQIVEEFAKVTGKCWCYVSRPLMQASGCLFYTLSGKLTLIVFLFALEGSSNNIINFKDGNCLDFILIHLIQL